MLANKFEKLLRSAEEGNAEAQYEVGRMLITGTYISDESGGFFVVDQDINRGLRLLKDSALQGFTPSQSYLYENEHRLNKRIKDRQRNRDVEAIAPYLLLAFVVLLIFIGFVIGVFTGWSSTFQLVIFAILSSTSTFWWVFIAKIYKIISENSQSIFGRMSVDRKKQAKLENRLVFIFGFVFVVVLLVIAILFPNPTDFQYTVFRILLSLSAAGIAAFIPGFLNVTVNNWLKAGGAMAVFAIVYFFSPAGVGSQ